MNGQNRPLIKPKRRLVSYYFTIDQFNKKILSLQYCSLNYIEILLIKNYALSLQNISFKIYVTGPLSMILKTLYSPFTTCV